MQQSGRPDQDRRPRTPAVRIVWRMSSATLQIVSQTPPLEWTWRLRDERGTLLTEAKLNPTRSGHQMLLEREALEQSPARTLTAAGTRPSQMALSLPFELIFGRGDPGAIVRGAQDRAPSPRLVTLDPRAGLAITASSDQR